jgi:hypothetical protein
MTTDSEFKVASGESVLTSVAMAAVYSIAATPIAPQTSLVDRLESRQWREIVEVEFRVHARQLYQAP